MAASLPVVTGAEYWAAVFGRPGEVEIEIGPGTGQFILCEAARRPSVNFLAIESSRRRAEHLETRVHSEGLRNLRVLHAPAQCVVQTCIPPRSVSAYHIYFPDPWWKRRHHRRRLLTTTFAEHVAHTLLPGGKVYFATDVEFLWNLAFACFSCHGGLSLHTGELPSRPVPTSFELKSRRRGAKIFEGTFVSSSAPHVAGTAPPEYLADLFRK